MQFQISDLSSDQYYLYLIRKTIVKKDIPSWNKVKNLEAGPLAKSRWLTMACRLCRLFISDKSERNLSPDEEEYLKLTEEACC